jgi:Ca-activated chloride channel family protein
MKRLFPPIVLTMTLALTACGASAEKLNNSGNEAFSNQDFEAALAAYQEAQTESPELAEPHYNAANVHYRQENYDQTQQEIEQTLIKDDGALTQGSLYNLGNTFFQKEEYETAIESYKEALRLNPNDLEAKENLELALRQMQQQQQEQQQEQEQKQQNEQQQEQQQQEQQDQQQQDNQQQNGDQGEQDQQQDGQPNDQQQNKDQQDDQQQDEDQSGDEQQDEQQQNDQQQGDQQQEQQPDQGDQQQDQSQGGQPGGQKSEGQPNGQPQQIEGLTEDQARQLLEAATQDTESLEEHLQQILVVPEAPPAEDW